MRKLLTLLIVVLVCCLVACKPKVNVDAASLSGDLKKLTEAIAAHPDDPELYYYRATYYYQQKRISEAQKDILQSIRLDDQQTKYYILLSDIYFAQHETDLAEENLQHAIKLDNSCNEARLKLAELYYYENMLDECMATIDEATQRKAHNPTAYLIKAFCYKEKQDTSNYLRMLYLVIDQDPAELKAHLELGYYYQQKKDPQAAMHYQNALLVDPNNEEINYNLAALYYDLGEVEKAIDQYKILLSITKEGVYAKNALYNLGYIVWTHNGDYKEAVSLFSQAIELDDKFVGAYAARGEVFEQMQEYDLAREDYNKCLSLETNCPAALEGLQSLDKKKRK